MVAVMILTAAPLSGFLGLELPDFGEIFSTKADAATYEVGDIIEFGSYPQSEVMDETLISKLESISKSWISYDYYSGTDISDGNMKPGDWMKYADIVYNGEKYRAVIFSQYRPGSTSATNSYQNTVQYDNGYTVGNIYYFHYEPLTWRVLDPTEGLVICENIIDSQAYNNTICYCNSQWYQDTSCKIYANDYAESSIREWLNSDFYDTAFDQSDKYQIKTTTCTNSAWNPQYSSTTTNDKVYLLSATDANNAEYGFSSYTESDEVRRVIGTDYAKCQGLYVYRHSDSYDGYSRWRLRTSGSKSYNSYIVDYDGSYMNLNYSYVDYTSEGIRPALKLNLKNAVRVIIASGYCGADGDNVKWTLYDDGELVISGSGAMDDYYFNPTKTPWCAVQSSIVELTIKDGVISIGEYAFNNCSNLTTITVPNSITSIGASAFLGCSGIKSIKIPNSVTTIDECAFHFCNSLESVTIPNSIMYIGKSAFSSCDSLADVYYTGTEVQWNNIAIQSYNEPLLNATIHFSVTETEKSIAILATEKSLSVKTGDSMWLGFLLWDKHTELIDEKWRKMSLSVSDPTIISLSDYEELEYGYALEVIGKKEGSTNVTITDTETGTNTVIVISVYDSFAKTYSYAIDNMSKFYPNNNYEDHLETNIYDLNGLYVNDYKCVENGNSYDVEFDVYNSRYYAGAVDIYDKSGMWLGYEEIDKYSDITNLWSTGEQAYYLVSNTLALLPGGNASNLLTYEQESFSKHTHISLEIPEGGYFTISNNVSNSPGTFIINALEILFDGAWDALDLLTSDSVKTSALSGFKKSAEKSLSDRLIEVRNESLKDEVKKEVQEIMLDTMQSEINDITEKFVQAELKDQLAATDETCSELANLAENILESFDISWKHLFQGVTGESIFTQFAGPAGVALKGCFAITKTTNRLLMVTQMATSTGRPYTTVYSSIEEGYINPYGVIVNTKDNMDTEAVLQVFRVSKTDEVDVILNNEDPLEEYDLYNICFVKDDQLVQPSGKVKVYIPIPTGMVGNTCKVYRQEANGSWTTLNAFVEENYLVFETDHFSLYAIVGNTVELKITSLPNKLTYLQNQSIDTTGLVLELNGEKITEGFYCEPCIAHIIGNQTITVKYGVAMTDFVVLVEELKHTHQYTARLTYPTCTEQGYTTYTCSCGDSYTDDYIPEKGHNEGVWNISTIYESSFLEYLTCSNCNQIIDIEVIDDFEIIYTEVIDLKYKDTGIIEINLNSESGNGGLISFSSSDTDVVSVDSSGRLTTNGTGSATITVTVTDEYGNTVTDTCKVEVSYKWWQWIIVIVLFGWIWY